MPNITATIPTPYTVTPIGGWYSIRANGHRCTFRLNFDGSCTVNVRQPLPAGSTYPNMQALADALAGVTS